MTDEEEEIMEGFKQTILDGQKEIEELSAALAARDRELAEARGFLASVLDCVDQSDIERLCRLADTISDWLEGKLAPRPAPACEHQGGGRITEDLRVICTVCGAEHT